MAAPSSVRDLDDGRQELTYDLAHARVSELVGLQIGDRHLDPKEGSLSYDAERDVTLLTVRLRGDGGDLHLRRAQFRIEPVEQVQAAIAAGAPVRSAAAYRRG